jgi:hypothetical protein
MGFFSIPRASTACAVAVLYAGMFGAAAASAQEGSVLPQPNPTPAPTPAQQAAPPVASDDQASLVVTAIRRSGALTIDGSLDEANWRNASAAGGYLTQIDPSEGSPSPERTELRVLYDDDAIYIGARMYDSTGDVRKRLGRRDQFSQDSDWFDVMLDSYHDHVNAYQFSVNPAGVKRDQVISGTGRFDSSWNAVWDAAAAIDDEGWSVEMRIPFSQLRFSSADMQTWGIQFQRRINRLQESSIFSFTPRGQRAGVAR